MIHAVIKKKIIDSINEELNLLNKKMMISLINLMKNKIVFQMIFQLL